MAPLEPPADTKFITPSDPFSATDEPFCGKYSVKPAPPAKGCQMLGYTVFMKVVNCAVEPDPSEWMTGMMGMPGSAAPLLSAVMAGASPLAVWVVRVLV